jgi:hypothetical protein
MRHILEEERSASDAPVAEAGDLASASECMDPYAGEWGDVWQDAHQFLEWFIHRFTALHEYTGLSVT